MKAQYSILFFCCFLLLACNKMTNGKNIVSKKLKWDFTQASFEESSIRLLNGYDVFDVNKLSDSLVVLNTSLFNSWKSKSKSFSDTLKLSENFVIKDSLGNPQIQILSYVKSKNRNNTIFFQLIVDAKSQSEHGFTKANNSTEELISKTDTVWYFNYRGKLFANNKNLKYFSDDLYYK